MRNFCFLFGLGIFVVVNENRDTYVEKFFSEPLQRCQILPLESCFGDIWGYSEH